MREHDLVVDLTGEARTAHRTGDVSVIARIARDIARILGPHTEVEEHGLFPALTADFPEQIATLEAEHRQIEAVLAQATDDPRWPDALLEALACCAATSSRSRTECFPPR